ncbi:Transforming growth factor-beta C-terminal [Trinorchestia longiramus]|nr:Transforming growth factor-beta C-terminal [Trinorchestia longiramus]
MECQLLRTKTSRRRKSASSHASALRLKCEKQSESSSLSSGHDSVLEASDSRGFEGRPDEGRPDEGRPGEGRPGEGNSSSQTFKFQLKLPKGEHVRNLLLRLHAIVKRKQSPVGLEGRMRVSLVRCSEVPSELSHQPCRDVDLAWKDVYLHNHSWLSFSIRGALEHVQRLPNELLTLRIQVERIFQTVGDPGKLRVDDSHDIDLQPLVLLYTTQHRLQKARQRRSLTEVDWEGFEEDLDSEDEIALASESDRSGRRAGRRRRTKNACKRKPLRVDFASIGWSDWVIAPTHYEAYQCSGKCFYPLASHLSPTKHAVIQTLMHSKSTDRARRACCVPTKLGPISLLYKEDGVMTFKKEYDGMVALECGCR